MIAREMEGMKEDRSVRQLYIHYSVSVRSSQFSDLAPRKGKYRWEEWMKWKKQQAVFIPNDNDLQY